MEKKIFVILGLAILLVGSVSAMTLYEKEVYNRMINPFSKLSYAIEKGLFLFSSWGQANDCSVYPDKKKILKSGDRIDCTDYCSYDKCAIDTWYDRSLYLGSATPTYSSSNPDWNKLRWSSEKSGDGTYFRAGSSHDYWYAEVYCCPRDVPVVSDHSTKAYVCETGTWDYKSRYDSDEYCRYDTSGVDLCWCADSNDNFYVDESGGVHCRSSARSSWCGSYVAHDRKVCTSAEKLYWYDSRGNINDLIESCSSNEKCTTSGCVADVTPPPPGVGGWNYCSSTNKCSEGQGDCDYIGTDRQCQSGLTCVKNVGANYGWSSSTDVCEKAGTVLTCNPEGNSCGGPSHLQSGQSCCTSLDCQNFQCVKTGGCSSGQTKCGIVGNPDASGDVYYTCVGGTYQSQGKVDGNCGYVDSPVCKGDADIDCNGKVDRSELGSFINKWMNNQVSRNKLGEVIQVWASS